MPTSIHGFGPNGELSPGAEAALDGLGGGSGVTETDAPTKPTEGASASYFVTDAVVWPEGLVWSTDPDGNSPPYIEAYALVSMFTLDGVTRAVMGATFPSEATTTTTTTAGTTTTTTTEATTTTTTTASTTTTTTTEATTTTTTTAGGGGGSYAWARRVTPEATIPADPIVGDTTHTYTVAGTAGRLLVAGFSVDKNAGPITVSAGWTLVAYNSGASVSGALAYRVATGSDDITWTLGGGTARAACCDVHEFTGFTSPTVDVFATFPDPPDDTAKTSLAVTAGNATADAMVVAIAGLDTQSEVAASGSTVDSGYTMRSWNSSGTSANVTLLMATKAVSAGGSTATTFGFGGTNDQTYGIVAAFKG